MFDVLSPAPADPILGLSEAFQRDENPNKVNLGVGVFKDAQGKTPTLSCVRKAEAKLLEEDASKTYLPITGAPAYGKHVQTLLFGAEHEVIASGRATSAQTPGGTGGLRVAGDFIHTHSPASAIWVSDPTWANHLSVFGAAGLEVKTYPYYDAATHGLNFEAMKAALKNVPAGDIVLLHGCCHNPTGVDPTPAQWAELAELRDEVGFVPLFDIAYQGFGEGLTEDVAGLAQFLRPGKELFIASSFSKNFGLYNERVGAVTLVAADKAQAEIASGHLKRSIRFNYSNPPRHGGAVVSTILDSAELTAEWHAELGAMRTRIHDVRSQLVEGLKKAGSKKDYSFISAQRGMFSFSGLNKDEVGALREKFGIYIVGSGRINVAGITPDKLTYLCDAMVQVAG